jgi:WD40 repeat protein
MLLPAGERIMVGLLALATMVLSAASDADEKEPDLQRALVLAKTLNDPSILSDAIVALGWDREREICAKIVVKAEASSGEARSFFEGVLQGCREAPLELVRGVVNSEIVRSVALSQDGIAIGSNERVIFIDVASGDELRSIRHDGTAPAFSSDWKVMFTGVSRYQVNLIDVAGNKVLWERGYNAQILAIALSPNEKDLAIGLSGGLSSKKTLLINAANGAILGEFDQKSATEAVAFSPDGKKLATGSGNEVYIVDIASGEVLLWDDESDDNVSDIVFSPDGKWLATGSGRKVRFFDLVNKKKLWEASCGIRVTAIAFSPDGKMLATGSNPSLSSVTAQPATHLINVANGKVMREICSDRGITSVAFSPDGKWIATGSFDKTARIWRTPW